MTLTAINRRDSTADPKTAPVLVGGADGADRAGKGPTPWADRLLRWLRALSWVMLWFYWAGFFDLLSWRWVDMGINVAIGTVGLLLRMGLGWLSREPREDWFMDVPLVLLRILLCVLRPHRACAALGMPTEEAAASTAVRDRVHPRRRARHSYRRYARYQHRSARQSSMGRYDDR